MASAHKTKGKKGSKKQQKKQKAKKEMERKQQHPEEIVICDSMNERSVCGLNELDAFLEACTRKNAAKSSDDALESENAALVTNQNQEGLDAIERIRVELVVTDNGDAPYIEVKLSSDAATDHGEASADTPKTSGSTFTGGVRCTECDESDLNQLCLSLKPLKWLCAAHLSEVIGPYIEMRTMHAKCIRHNQNFGFNCLHNQHDEPHNKTNQYENKQKALYAEIMARLRRWLKKNEYPQYEIFARMPKAAQKVLAPPQKKEKTKYYSGLMSLYDEDDVVETTTTSAKSMPEKDNVQLDEEGFMFSKRGLVNLGNTCFYNSVLQCLLRTEPLARFYLGFQPSLPEETPSKDPPATTTTFAPAAFSELSFWQDVPDFAAFDFAPKEDSTSAQAANNTEPAAPQSADMIDPQQVGPLNKAITHLFRHMYSKDTASFRPNWILDQIGQFAPQFRRRHQQDSHELLRFLQMLASSEFTNARQNIIDRTFSFKVRTTVICEHCRNASVRVDDSIDLSVPIPKKRAYPIAQACEETYKKEKRLHEEYPDRILDPQPILDSVQGLREDETHLAHCLWGYFAVERLSEKSNNGYLCDKCSYVEEEVDGDKVTKKEKRSAYLQFGLERPPEVLTIQLKRFEQSDSSSNSAKGRKVQTVNKLDQKITLPPEIDIAPFFHPDSVYIKNGGSTRYALYGIVNHIGRSLTSGHYVSYTKQLKMNAEESKRTDDFLYQSDTHVKQSSAKELHGQEGYLLFYEKIPS